jgi:hypothetical protein
MLSPRQMFLLENACWPIRRAFIDHDDPMSGLYLVGSTMTGEKSNGARDTDVRLMLSDRKYASLNAVIGMTGIRFLGIAIGQYLASTTGLPIDFQLQQTTAANDEHGPYRNPLGSRDIDSFVGDGEPKPAKPASDLTEREEAEIAALFAKLKPEHKEG